MSSLRDTGHRDTQRGRLYSAESASGVKREISSAAGRRLLDEQARLIPQNGWLAGPVTRPGKRTTYAASVEDCQRYVDDLVRAAWFQRRFGQRTYRVVWKASGNATCSHSATIALPPWSRTEGVILHEIAHGIPHEGAWHGPEFAAILLTLVRHRLGKPAADRLRAAYRQHKVRAKVAAVPKPDRAVVTATARRERAAHRQAATDRDAARLSSRERDANVIRYLAARPNAPFGPVGSKSRRAATDTARTLAAGRAPRKMRLREGDLVTGALGVRAAIRRGEFGPVGSKPRTRAMAVARTLDKQAERYRAVSLAGRRVYAATPQKW